MQERTDLLKVESEQAYTEDSKKNPRPPGTGHSNAASRKKSSLPDVDDVISEWFSEEHPDRLQHLNWNKDHAQYREYHKTL